MYGQWNVWNANWIHEDDSSKERPVVIISSLAHNIEKPDDIWVAKIQGKDRSLPYKLQVLDSHDNFKDTGLTKSCFVYFRLVRRVKKEDLLVHRGVFLDDLQKINIPDAAKKVSCPALIIHGDADETVPVGEAHELFALLPGTKKMCVLEGADHRFSEPQYSVRTVNEALDWLTRHLPARPAETRNL